MTQSEFIEIMNEFCGYYSKTLNTIEKRFWSENFINLDKSCFKRKINEHIKTSKNPFFPTIGEINSILLPPNGSIGA
jgi:hypothetical protein